jgi:hypothetical protein
MLKKLFGRLTGSASSSAPTDKAEDPLEAALLRQIEAKSKDDPLIGAKVGAKLIGERMLAAMTTKRGVHIESMLCALGSLAGYSCQASVRAQARAQGLDEEAHFVRAEGADGKTYFFGDPLNKLLAESPHSVWSLAAGGAQIAGCTVVLELDDIFRHVAGSVGTADFGDPRLPPEHTAHDTPLNYVKAFWPQLFPLISKFCPDPEHWPLLLGLAIQELIVQGKEVLDPCLSLRVVMESAILMSKVDLQKRG